MKIQDFLKSPLGIQILIIISGSLLFIPFLGQVHLFDWDEINFAESAREMIVSGNYLDVQINFKPFWEKPPLFIWMQVLSMKVFGVNEFAARFPNAICGIFTLLVLFRIGTHLYNKKFGLIWVITYLGSFLPFFYFKSGIIDPWFNVFIFTGVYYILKYLNTPSIKFATLSAFFIGLSVLTKGPVGFLIFALTLGVFLIVKKFRVKVFIRDVLVYAAVLTFVGGFWFLLQILNGNYDIIVDFINYQIELFSEEGAGHGGFLLYHFVILFIGVFPASVIAIRAFKRSPGKTMTDFMRLGMIILFWTVLILFTIVNTKIVHYSSMCYFPLTYLAAYAVYKIHLKESAYKKWISIITWTLGAFFITAIVAFPIVGMNTDYLLENNIVKGSFERGNLEANVPWSGFESLVAIFLLIGLIGFQYFIKKKKFLNAYIILYSFSIVFIFIAMTVFTPRIEGYSQKAVIDFYKEKANEDCYIEPLGYKSYAHYFYAKRKTYPDKKITENWLLNGNTDKKAYFVFKVNKENYYFKKYPQLEKLYSKNGFVFCYRNNKNDTK